MKNEIQKMIEKYRIRCDDCYHFSDRIIYKNIIKDLEKLLLMEIRREKKCV